MPILNTIGDVLGSPAQTAFCYSVEPTDESRVRLLLVAAVNKEDIDLYYHDMKTKAGPYTLPGGNILWADIPKSQLGAVIGLSWQADWSCT